MGKPSVKSSVKPTSRTPTKSMPVEEFYPEGVCVHQFGTITGWAAFSILKEKLNNQITKFDEIITITQNHQPVAFISVNITRWEIYVDIYADNCRWTRGILHTIFDHLFNTRRRVTAIVSSENKKCQKFMKQLGFKREGTLRRAFDGTHDEIYFGFLYSDYQKSPWFNPK